MKLGAQEPRHSTQLKDSSMINVFILNWNPEKWHWDDEEYAHEVAETAKGRWVNGRWSVGSRTGGIRPGDRAFLLRQHTDRGIVSSGRFTSEVFPAPHWDGSSRTANYADVSWNLTLDTDNRLPVEELIEFVPEVAWNRLQGSGTQVPQSAAERLIDLWANHTGLEPFQGPDDVFEAGTYREGDVTQVLVNRYERDPRARAECITAHGTACSICGFDFATTYGELGNGYIHVHHLTELSTLGKGAEINPQRDLRPVCPNCHAMLHRQRPALTIEQLKRRLKRR